MKKSFKEDGLEYIKKISDVNYYLNNPFSLVYYRPEIDTSMECNED